jgi:hypothetical protein
MDVSKFVPSTGMGISMVSYEHGSKIPIYKRESFLLYRFFIWPEFLKGKKCIAIYEDRAIEL